MAFSDFRINSGSGNSVNFNPPTGSSFLNADLANPLTSSVQCRVFSSPGTTSAIRSVHVVSSSVSGGMFVNIPNTKSVSLRVWGRAVNSNSGFGLLAKHNGFNTDLFSNSSVVATNNKEISSRISGIATSGYEFTYFQNTSNASNFIFNSGIGPTTRTLIYSTGSLGTTPLNGRWVGLRMDIIPVTVEKIINNVPTLTTFKDVIRFYTAELPNTNNWTLRSTVEVFEDNNPISFVPWGSYQASGSIFVATSSYGFSVINSNADIGQPTYIDDFQMFVEG